MRNIIECILSISHIILQYVNKKKNVLYYCHILFYTVIKNEIYFHKKNLTMPFCVK